MEDEGFDSGGDSSPDVSSDTGSDTGSDYGGDLASDDGVDLGSDVDSDMDTDLGGDIDSGTSADINSNIGEDLNADEPNGDMDDEPAEPEETAEQPETENDLSNDIQELRPEYFEDLRNRSEYPDTIIDNGNDWARRDVSENAEMRDEFDDVKRDLIHQWEDENCIPWPAYNDDVYTDTGNRIRGAGDRYDAHHIQPLTYGGENTASNITPLHALEHFDKKGVHAPDSPFGRMGSK